MHYMPTHIRQNMPFTLFLINTEARSITASPRYKEGPTGEHLQLMGNKEADMYAVIVRATLILADYGTQYGWWGHYLEEVHLLSCGPSSEFKVSTLVTKEHRCEIQVLLAGGFSCAVLWQGSCCCGDLRDRPPGWCLGCALCGVEVEC